MASCAWKRLFRPRDHRITNTGTVIISGETAKIFAHVLIRLVLVGIVSRLQTLIKK
jgi:hypothetical protein